MLITVIQHYRLTIESDYRDPKIFNFLEQVCTVNILFLFLINLQLPSCFHRKLILRDERAENVGSAAEGMMFILK